MPFLHRTNQATPARGYINSIILGTQTLQFFLFPYRLEHYKKQAELYTLEPL